MEQAKIIDNRNLKWEPHPQIANAEVAYLLSNREDGTDLTCLLVHLAPGIEVEKHSHECDDIIYVLQGRAVLWIDGVGDVPLIKGSFVRIPKGVTHQPHSIEEDFIAYDVFYPFLA